MLLDTGAEEWALRFMQNEKYGEWIGLIKKQRATLLWEEKKNGNPGREEFPRCRT